MLDDEVWNKILDFSKSHMGKPVPLLNPKRSSPFIITKVSDEHIRIDKIPIKMTKEMFLKAYNYLKSRSGWVDIGARRVGARPETLEGFIKTQFFKGNMDTLSTATWFSAILVHSNIGVEFNNKAKGQKLKLNMKRKQCGLNNFIFQ
jgi:hypothetical protein